MRQIVCLHDKDKEDVILAAAVQVFMEKGFAGTSIQDIAFLDLLPPVSAPEAKQIIGFLQNT